MFKLEDRVRIVEKSHYYDGQIGVIMAPPFKLSGHYKVMFEDGRATWCFGEFLRPLEFKERIKEALCLANKLS